MCLGGGEKEILGCHKIRTRGSESGYWIDLHLLVEPDLTTRRSHEISSHVERRLKTAYGEPTDVIIHIEPGRQGVCSADVFEKRRDETTRLQSPLIARDTCVVC
ncbi:MAG: cation transporter dimerization domain-containing protein [Thermoleophilia bacterium]